MNKTIINGIDVSECEFYYEMDDCDGCHQLCNNATDIKNEYCEHYQNCYFKQLQRLKKENEELKASFNELYNNTEQLANKYNKYGGNKENEFIEIINKTTDERNKYKQALENIREIAKFNQFYNSEKLLINGDIGQIQNLEMTEIYNKIDEVLNDRD